MVPADSDGISPVPPYSGSWPHKYPYPYGTLTLCGLASQPVQVQIFMNLSVLQPPSCRNIMGLGCSAFARHYLRNHSCFLFLRVLRCFSSPGSPPFARVVHLQCTGLSHSEICGSTRMCRSPQLIAAYHVLHRLWEPRHSPYALILLIVLFCSLMSLKILCQYGSLHTNRFSRFSFPNMSMNVSDLSNYLQLKRIIGSWTKYFSQDVFRSFPLTDL